MKKRIISLLLAVVMIVGMLPLGAITAFAEQSQQTVITTDTTVKDKTITGNFEDSKSAYLIKGDGNIKVTFQNVTFDNVKTDVYGPCVHVNKSSGELILEFIDCRFINCGNGSRGGGAIYIQKVPQQNSITFKNCYADNCQAQWGGFMYADAENANISAEDMVISNCSATKEGGAICIWDNDKIALNGFVFIGNTSEYGGAIYNNGSADGNGIKNCRFYGNTATTEGGAVYLNDNNAKISYCTFVENTGNGKSELYYKNKQGVNNCTYISSSNLNGDGTEAEPYTISSTDDWDTLYYKVKKGDSFSGEYFILKSNITVYVPVGVWGGTAFSGNFNGNGKTVKLCMPIAKDNNAAFNYTDGAIIENLTTDGCVKGKSGAAGIVSHAENTTVINCVNNAEIIGTEYIGGIVGYSKNTKTENCTNNGSVSGSTKYIGGIAGWMGDSSVTVNCVNNGTVSGDATQIGGIVGWMGDSSVTVNCVNNGTVSGDATQIGGIVGYIASSSTVRNCINKGAVESTQNSAGGIIGAINDSTAAAVKNVISSGEASNSIVGTDSANATYTNCFYVEGESSVGTKITADQLNGKAPYKYNYLFSDFLTENSISDGMTDTAYFMYKNEELSLVSSNEAVIINSDTSDLGKTGETTVYKVDGAVEHTGRVQVTGNVVLLISDGASYTVNGGIKLGAGNTLTVIASRGDNKGELTATVSRYSSSAAGIGVSVNDKETEAGTLNIFGGKITAQGGYSAAGIGAGQGHNGGTVNIFGGEVIATGDEVVGAGIGAGHEGNGGTVNIYGGDVKATGGQEAAGIGGGEYGNGGTVNVYAGTVTAQGGSYGAGIGGGRGSEVSGGGNGGTTNIFGGKVTATGGQWAAGIGCGYETKKVDGTYTYINIDDGVVEAVGGSDAVGIGNGKEGTNSISVTLNTNKVAAYICTPEGEYIKLTGDQITTVSKVIVLPMIRYEKAPTCTEAGYKAHFYNSVDGKYYTDIDGKELIVDIEAWKSSGAGYLQKLEHNWKIDTDNRTHHICSFCNETEEHIFIGGVCVCGAIEEAIVGKYIERKWDGSKVTETEQDIPTDAIKITSRTTDLEAGKWYIVSGNVTVTGRITVKGTKDSPTNLILMDGCTLTVQSGVVLNKDYVLNIYGQEKDTGKISAKGDVASAGIGGCFVWNTLTGNDGGTLTVYGGTVEGNGTNGGAGIGGSGNGNGCTLTVYGGTVSAVGSASSVGGSASIGGGGNGDGGSVTVYGGTVNAGTAEITLDIMYGVGIGGGNEGDGGSVTVYGGTVNAIAHNGPGIGDDGGDGSSVTVYGGEVFATGDYSEPGIRGDVRIYGGTVTAIGSSDAHESYKGIEGSLTLGDHAVIKAGGGESSAQKVTEYNGEHYVQIHYHTGETLTSISDTEHWCSLCEKAEDHTFVDGVCVCGAIKYIERKWDGSKVTETEHNIPTDAIKITSGTTDLEAGKWYVVSENVTVTGTITVKGTANSPTNLILMDGCTLTAQSGIALNKDYVLNIYGQEEDTGKISAKGDTGSAGIGGYFDWNTYKGNDGGTLTVYGGTVEGNGTYGGAGIGGSTAFGNGCTLTVYGGTVSAVGSAADGGGAASIGGGLGGNGGSVTVYGGTVNAGTVGITYGVGIGGDDIIGDGGSVTVYGGTVNAIGRNGAGIGGGESGDGSSVTVYGGEVFATAKYGYFAGIRGDVKIYDGTVTATGGSDTQESYKGIEGSLTLGDHAVIKAGGGESSAQKVTEYKGEHYVQFHFHNAKTCTSISEAKHKCSFCGAEEDHIDEKGDGKCDVCEAVCHISDVDYFYIKNIGSVAATITWYGLNLQYSIGNKNSFAAFTGSVTLQPGETCYFKGNNNYLYRKTVHCYTSGAKLAVGGDIGSLLNETGNIQKYPDDVFGCLFENLGCLYDISELTLCRENTVLGEGCYSNMFLGCSALTAIPEDLLPAEALADFCYEFMFAECSALTSIPADLLPAEALADYCYNCMFNKCTKLTAIPEGLLPAKTLAYGCYAGMFDGCSALTSIPQGLLPATTLVERCYFCMFYGCTALTAIPEGLLPAEALATDCYSGMFTECAALTTIPEGLFPAKTLATDCYHSMFKDCTALTAVPKGLLPATTLATGCYGSMFYGCKNLTNAPDLPAGQLCDKCYCQMFCGCENLAFIKLGFDKWGNDSNESTKKFLPNKLAYYLILTIICPDKLDTITRNDNCIPDGILVRINECTVTFDLQGHGTEIRSQEVDLYGKVTKPSDPVAVDYEFGGWYKEAECINPWDFDTDTVTENITLYAKWITNCSVYFNMQGHGAEIYVQEVESYGKVTKPTDPTAVGYRFDGWYKEPECINPWDFDADTVMEKYTNLYAKWTKLYTVTFDLGYYGTEEVPSQFVEYGGKVTKPASDPISENYIFGGWYEEAECIHEWNFEKYAVSGDTTIYAKWITGSCTVWFCLGDEEGTRTQYYHFAHYGQELPNINVPTRNGLVFLGYYAIRETDGSVQNVQYYNSEGEAVCAWDIETPVAYLVAFWAPAGTGGHTHTFAESYTFNETHHWRECTCEDEKCKNLVDDFATHTFTVVTNADGSKTYTCVCGYTKVVYDKPDDEGEIVTGVSYTGISLTLGSDISINFYMNLTDEARQNGKMTFNIGGRIVTGIKARENENGHYFSTPLTALEMAETVTATFTYNGIDYVQEYSVADYIEAIIYGKDKDGKDYSDEMKALAKKIANYGYYAQIYLASIHSNVTIGKDGYEEMDKFDDVDIDVEKAIEALANYKVTVSGTSDNLSLYGSTVYFDAATALNYYVTVKNGVEPTAKAVNTVTGEEKQVEIKLYKGNIYIVSVKDILATELADDITVTINGEITLTGSVFAYCNSVVKAHSFDGATEKDTFAVNAMAAFYEYYKAAVDYAKTQG